MHTPRAAFLILLAACTAGGDSAAPAEAGLFTEDERTVIDAFTGLSAPADDPTNAVASDLDAARLGQWLFFDASLSSSGTVSCATCHDPELGFSDGLALSEGLSETGRHSMSLWNTAYNRWFYWDGRCDTQWCQALKPLEHPAEMGGSRLAIAHRLYADAELKTAYEAVFGALPDLSDTARFPAEGRPVADDPTDPLDVAWSSMASADQEAINVVFSRVGKSIAAYERLLLTGAAPFDDYAGVLQAEGEVAARASGHLSDAAERGLKIVAGEGNCHFCHSGPGFTNGEFHNIGLADRDWLDSADTGRYEGIPQLLVEPFRGTGAYSDDPEAAAIKLDHLVQGPEQLGQFKVPTLRNVAQSPPYMHGGQLETLEDVVRFYSESEEEPVWGHREELLVPLELSDEDIADVVAFLEALTGPGPAAALLVAPDSPLR
ncbi:MAG: cytochrome c peroxidase [Myxococcota bacterium]|jgi:cytochrome c peroxidase